jgi:hypothetical protein
MMRLLRRATLLVTVSLLTSAATAYAECAWVMWTETEAMSEHPAGRWTLVSFDRNVYDTRKACEAALIQWIEGKAESARDVGTKVFRRGEASPDYKDHFLRIDTVLRRVTEVFRERAPGLRNIIVEQYTCLPDTVDPRGPKGGGR